MNVSVRLDNFCILGDGWTDGSPSTCRSVAMTPSDARAQAVEAYEIVGRRGEPFNETELKIVETR